MSKSAEAKAFSVYETAAGFGVVAAGDAGIVAHHLPYGTTSAAEALELVAAMHPAADGESALTATAAAQLRRYFSGEKTAFDFPLDLDCFTEFQRGVYRAVAGIPYGIVMSYADVAAACGSPKAARAIGAAMARNPLPILIPCHRVVASNGLLTGFTAPGGLDSKRELLMMEGALFNARGGVQRTVF